MATELTITWNIGRNSRNPTTYAVSLNEANDQPFSLRQIGPVTNSVCYSRGVYETRRNAVEAALDYIAVPCRLFEIPHPLGDARFEVTGHGTPAPQGSRLLGSNSPAGRFVAA